MTNYQYLDEELISMPDGIPPHFAIVVRECLYAICLEDGWAIVAS